MKREAKTLIVDDSTAILEIMAGILDSYGIKELASAEDGSQALSLFKQALQAGEPFSLVFLDIVMPVMDGQETLQRMRALEKEAGIFGTRSVIIMVTSLHSTDDMMHAIIDGDCDDYLVKPFEPEHLQHMLVKYGFRENV